MAQPNSRTSQRVSLQRSLSTLPLPARAISTLDRHGFRTLADLVRRTRGSVGRLDGIGETFVRDLDRCLHDFGLEWADDEPITVFQMDFLWQQHGVLLSGWRKSEASILIDRVKKWSSSCWDEDKAALQEIWARIKKKDKPEHVLDVHAVRAQGVTGTYRGHPVAVRTSVKELNPRLERKVWVADVYGPSQGAPTGSVSRDRLQSFRETEDVERMKRPDELTDEPGAYRRLIMAIRKFVDAMYVDAGGDSFRE